MKSRLALFLTLSGWLYGAAFLYFEYSEYGEGFFKHLFSSNEADFISHISIILILVISNVAGYLINQRTRLLKETEDAGQKYKDLYENAPDGYCSLNKEGVIVRANKTLTDSLGLEAGALIGKVRLAGLAREEKDVMRLSVAIGNVKRTGFAEDIEIDLRKNDGSTAPVLIKMRGVQEEDGAYRIVRAIIHDITAIKEREKKLIEGREAYFNMLKDLDISLKEMKEIFEDLVLAFANALDAKSSWTRGHSERVSKYCTLIAGEMGTGTKDIENLRMASLLHDIGKIGTYDSVLDKPGNLTPEERTLVNKHPAKGVEILKPIKKFKEILPIIRHHHERMDGGGYPDGLKGKDIPLLSRIITAADSYDSMTADRPYRPALEREIAVEEMLRCSGTQFDPSVIEAFLVVLGTEN